LGKVRVYEAAKKLGIPAKQLVEELRAKGVDVKSHSSSVDESVVAQLTTGGATAGPAPPAEATDAAAGPQAVSSARA
jgi:translation initiation factor IF-2